MSWADAVAKCSRQNIGFVVVTVLSVEGSSPRAKQVKMVVSSDKIYDSVGGGNLEFDAIQSARSMLHQQSAMIEKKIYNLGEDLTQCCGGQVELLFEYFPACDFNIVLCGAGHVGKALVSILAELPCRVSWMDTRPDVLESAVKNVELSSRVSPRHLHNPHQAVEDCEPGSWYLIMTHSHELDFELSEAILGRADIEYCGLIGSKSKAASFRGRLKRKGFSAEEISRLTSPIGIPLGAGRSPMEVAVSISAQLLQLYYSRDDAIQSRAESSRLSVVGPGKNEN